MNELNDRWLSGRYSRLIPEVQVSKLALFGFECGDGWLGLIDGTLDLIQRHSIDLDVDIRLRQVKEKFGELRIYSQGGDNLTREIFDIAELVSGKTCEICGQPGQLCNRQGWMQVRCNDHIQEIKNTLISYDPMRKYSQTYSATIAAIISLFGEQALTWVRSPAQALGGRKPYELLNTTEGCCEILKMIIILERGAYILTI